jgi:DNA-binding NarL/FixJ family response regulator
MTRTVLILDDDKAFRDLIKLFLEEELGLRVLEASTGSEANVINETEKPDLLIVDGRLPDTDGTTWIEEYRKVGGEAHIIFLSGLRQDPAFRKKMQDELGVALTMDKQVDFNQVTFAEIVRSQFKDSLFLPPAESSPAISIQNRLSEVIRKYAAELPLHISKLEQAIYQVKCNPGNQSLLNEACQCAHKIYGTAASCGFGRVSEAAGKIEEVLLSLGTETSEVTWQILDSAISFAKNNVSLISPPGELIKKYEKQNTAK